MSDLKNVKVSPTPKPKPEIGIDTEGKFIDNILETADSGTLDMSSLNSFLTVAQTREAVYSTIDVMASDEILSAVLETYAEDSTQTNDEGKIVWAESDDADVNKYVNWLLEALNVDKHIFNWTYSLCKYGDVYLRLFHESDYEKDDLFTAKEQEHKSLTEDYKKFQQGNSIQEDVNVKLNSKSDHFVHYVEAVSNPGEIFELTRFGKTAGYIEAPTAIQNPLNDINMSWQQYKMRQSDVNIYSATDFVHASLQDTSSRKPEEVRIFRDDNSYKNNVSPLVYKVKRGQSLLYNSFRIWRELTLLENSVLLNRVTKSSIVRIISVEVGDMPKDKVQAHLAQIKKLIEQKSSIDTDNRMSEYNNAGPVENNIYIPVHEGKGAITTDQIGGDVDPKSLADLSWFQNKLFGSLRAPKQFFSMTDDSTGFNGGTSLTIISSRYGKFILRVQNTMAQALTDLINIMLIDKGLTGYVNKFKIRMQAPITQEELDKRENLSNRIRIIGDLMNILTDIDDPADRLKILKSLLASVVTDSTVAETIQEVIDKLDAEKEKTETTGEDEEVEEESTGNMPIDSIDTEVEEVDMEPVEIEPEEEETEKVETETTETEEPESYLPSPDELNFNAVENK